MKKCKHKHTQIINEEIGGFNIPDGCTTEYDIYCEDCKKIIAHWAYGSFDDPEDVIKYQTKGIKKEKAWFRYYVIVQIKDYFINKKIDKLYKNNNNDLPF